MKKILSLKIVIILFISTIIIFYNTALLENTKVDKDTATQSELLSKALRILGVDKSNIIEFSTAEASLKKVNLYDSLTPFIADSINKKELWMIEIDSVMICNEDDENIHYRDFTIYLDSGEGGFIKIVSKYGNINEKELYLTSKEKARQRLDSQREKYCGFSPIDPEINFFKALRSTIGDPYEAKQITGMYILHSRKDKEPKPVWVIQLYGTTTPLDMRHPDLLIKKDYFRTVVDAKTGEFIIAGNGP